MKPAENEIINSKLEQQAVREHNELMLHQALKTIAQEEEEELNRFYEETSQLPPYDFSPEFERKMDKLLRKARRAEQREIRKAERLEAKKTRAPSGHRRLRTVFACLALVLLVGVGAKAMQSEAFLEQLRSFLFENFGLYTKLDVKYELPEKYKQELLDAGWTEVYYPEYLPGGYELTDVKHAEDILYMLEFSNGENMISIRYLKFINKPITEADTENAHMENFIWQGHEALYSEKNGVYLFHYQADDYVIRVRSNRYKKDVLMLIAEQLTLMPLN